MTTELICPICKQGLEEGDLFLCPSGHEWENRNGIAVLIPPDLQDTVVDTIETFAYKWEFDPAAVKEERERIATKWFVDRVGVEELTRLLASSSTILDAGCGFGHLTHYFARTSPNAKVWGIDLSIAVHNVERLPNMRLIQGDLTRLPIEGKFDLIVSDGVLHHTASTEQAVKALVRSLAPGGSLLFYVYRKKSPVREFCDDWIRKHATEMSPEDGIELSRALADLGRQLREAKVTLQFEKPIDCLGIPSGKIDLQRFFYWYIMKCFWDDGGNVAASIIENFDWYHPRLAWRHTVEEVESWADGETVQAIHVESFDSGILAQFKRA